MLATDIDKTVHIPKPIIPLLDNYWWTVTQSKVVPVTSIAPMLPEQMSQSLSCVLIVVLKYCIVILILIKAWVF